VEEELRVRCSLVEVGVFRYEADDPHTGLVEHEVDHVFVGALDRAPVPNPLEVGDLALLSLLDVGQWMEESPHSFTPWSEQVLRVAQTGIDARPSESNGPEY
jgi:isopentenyl-diphosphate delta-isomerase